MNKLEICVDSMDSARIAQGHGADRIELCWDLSVGGVTPSAGFVKSIKDKLAVPLYVLIRPRAGLFCYQKHEVKQMMQDIVVLKQFGIGGFVFGALTTEGEVNTSVCGQLLNAARPLPCTFHRAFDLVQHKERNLETIIQLGFERILTTGGKKTAFDGMENLRKLVFHAGSRIIIMPGGNINDENILAIKDHTQAMEFHSSARNVDPETNIKSRYCSGKMITKMSQIINPSVVNVIN